MYLPLTQRTRVPSRSSIGAGLCVEPFANPMLRTTFNAASASFQSTKLSAGIFASVRWYGFFCWRKRLTLTTSYAAVPLQKCSQLNSILGNLQTLNSRTIRWRLPILCGTVRCIFGCDPKMAYCSLCGPKPTGSLIPSRSQGTA